MEGHVPNSQSVPQKAASGLSENAGPTPTPNVGRPGVVNGPAAIPHVVRGLNGSGVGGTSSLPLQGQVPV